MSNNNFGATVDEVLLQFAAGDYAPTATDFGGTDAINDAIAAAADAVAQAMPLALLEKIQHPDLERIVTRATQGQTVCHLGFAPVVLGTVHIWTGPPQAFAAKPILITDPWARMGGWSTNTGPGVAATPVGPQPEKAETDFSVVADGTVTLAAPLNRSDQVFASYDVNVDDATFRIASIANAVANGAAAALGAKVYPQASAEWAYVTRLGEGWADYLGELAAGRLVPAELRTKQWWEEPDRVQEGGMGSVRRYRG